MKKKESEIYKDIEIASDVKFPSRGESVQGEPVKEESVPESAAYAEVSHDVPPGWDVMDTAPKNGDRIVISETGKDQVSVYWRERRVVDKAKLRYIKEGNWTECLSRLDIKFSPKYWRPYDASEYIPVPRAQ